MGNKYGKDIIIQGSARILGGVFAFFSVFVLTYLFNEKQIGQYNIILSTINFIVSMMTLWISQSILRFYSNSDDNNSIFIMTIVVSLIGIILFAITDSLMNFHSSIYAYIYLILFAFYNILDAIFRRQRELYRYAILELSISIGKIIPMIFIAKITYNIDSIFISQSILLIVFILSILLKNGNYRDIKFSIDINLLKKYLKYGLPLIGLSVSSWLLSSSDRYIIRYFKSNYEVGIYSTNYSLANNIYMMFALILINVFHPIIMKVWDDSHKKAEQLTSDVIEKYILFMSPFIFFGCYRSNVLLGLFNGSTYSRYNNIFVWTALGIFLYGLSLLYHKYFELTNKTRYILVYNLICAITNIVLNLIFIPIFGFASAALTTLIAYIEYLLLVILKTHNKFKIKLSVKKIMLIAISNLIYYMISHTISPNESFKLFLVEGVCYIMYTIIFYQITSLFDFRPYIKKFILNRTKRIS